ncbi:MAG: GTP-binding protein [Fibrobacteres bacterium]|nr:GTP-binding protein [Fibrobacterota bacterium]
MATPPKDTRSIAILAHVDAGKTTVSERLLYFSETIPGLGEVDEGLATMDYLEEERKRGITIEAGIASYQWKGTRVTFVDTPGHVDFGVEVDFALQAVEGVILVLSGVSGIESQSLEAWEKVRANKNQALLFINKLDLTGADYRKVMEQIEVMFRVKPVALTLPVYLPELDGVIDVLNQLALYRSVENPRKLIKGEVPALLAEAYAKARQDLIDVASQFDDGIASAWLAGEEIPSDKLVAGLKLAMRKGGHIPVYMGSALKNVGIRQLMNGINLLLPPSSAPSHGAIGFIIKIRHYQDIGKIFLAKIFDPDGLKTLPGTRCFRVFAESLEEIKDLSQIRPGDVIALQSPQHYRMGQMLLPNGQADAAAPSILTKKYRPLLQSRIELVNADDYAYVDKTLKTLAETEPSIAIAPDPGTGGWLISTVGELQLDVFCKRLKKDHKCDIKIGAPNVRYLEKLKAAQKGLANAAIGMGAEIRITADLAPLPEEANSLTYGIPVSPAYREVIESVFSSFCSEGVCGIGSIAGLGCRITGLTGSSDPVPLPLLAKCFTDCLKLHLSCAQLEVLEPIMRLEIIIPDEFCGLVLADLAARGGIIRKLDSDGYNSIILLEIPLANTFGYTTLLRSLSKGLGVYVLTFEKYGAKRTN